jgi:hypothetical protein
MSKQSAVEKWLKTLLASSPAEGPSGAMTPDDSLAGDMVGVDYNP